MGSSSSPELTPWELVCKYVEFPSEINGVPFVPEPKQIETINQMALNFRAGIWLDMGTGKTFVSTAVALYWMITGRGACVVIMPPNLIIQWLRWLSLLRYKEDGTPIEALAYKGEPQKRRAMHFEYDFVLVGIQIFKRDYERFRRFYQDKNYSVIVDEATFCANINSDNHEAVYEFALGRPVQMLSGTPANAPLDAYGLIRFTAPGTYLNFVSFKNVHVEAVDVFDRPRVYKNLDTLQQNLLINGKRILYEDMYSDVEKPLYDLIYYDLHEDHYKLYTKLAEEQLLSLPDGGKIDATSVHRLRHALGQIILNHGHFAGQPGKNCAGLEMLEERLRALQGGKIVVFAHYKMTVANIVERFRKYKAVAINSAVSDKQKDLNKQQFIEDPDTKLIVIQYVSGGKGLDGMQHASHTAMCIEPCQQPRDFHQAIARLKRKGQKRKVHVMLPVARRTLQMRAFNALLTNDALVNQVVRNAVQLREEIFGTNQPELNINEEQMRKLREEHEEIRQ